MHVTMYVLVELPLSLSVGKYLLCIRIVCSDILNVFVPLILLLIGKVVQTCFNLFLPMHSLVKVITVLPKLAGPH